MEGPKCTFENGTDFFVKNELSCKSKNVIYVIFCTTCNMSYIGQTNSLQNRVTTHKQQIRDDTLRHLKVSKHLFNCSNGVFKIFPFYQVLGNDNATQLLLSKEKYFISKFSPSLNSVP